MSTRPATTTAERSLGLEQVTVAVVMGGRSSEREVSLVSGRQVLEALARPEGPEDRRGPGRVIAVEILADGRWRVGKRAMMAGEAAATLADVDVLFLALHGGEGENGALQGLLTCADLAFTGSGVIASAVAMDKVFARIVASAAGIRTAPGEAVARATWPSATTRARLEALVTAGCVVKPRRGGSSVGCSIVHRTEELDLALERAFQEGAEVLVEGLVRGVECTGGVVRAPGGELVALPPVEIRPRSGFFDYREKYAEDGALELCPPVSLDATACERVRARALDAHRALACEGYSRSDFIVPEDGGEPVFLETNTLPGLTPRSLLPRAAREAGIDYRTLCLWIVADGIARGAERRDG